MEDDWDESGKSKRQRLRQTHLNNVIVHEEEGHLCLMMQNSI